jgi:hypothetical protein
MCKEAAGDLFEMYPGIRVEGLGKTTKTLNEDSQ